MLTMTMIWLLTATGIAVAVIFDMRRLAVNRVGLSRAGWLCMCAGTGPLAIAAYLVCRRAVWRELIDSVWKVIGDGSYPLQVRRKRLIALRRNDLIGEAVFHRCLRVLGASHVRRSD
jgi:hypothetical protein